MAKKTFPLCVLSGLLIGYGHATLGDLPIPAMAAIYVGISLAVWTMCWAMATDIDKHNRY